MDVKISFLESHIKLGELLQKKLHYSKNSIKNHLTKKQIDKDIHQKDVISLPINLVNMNLINPNYTGVQIEIIFEDENFIVLNKPENMHGHCLNYEEDDTVLNFLRSKYNLAFLSEAIASNHERGLLYRLDSTTSGVLIFVKDQVVHEKLRDNFSKIAHKKEYLALVEGNLDIDKFVIHTLAGSEQKGQKIINSATGVECRAHYKSLLKIKEFTLVRVILQTGFRHQIRAQLSLIGHPIVGDKLYGAIGEAPRIYLHALRYEIELDGEVLTFSADKNLLFCDFLNTDSLLKVLA